MKNRYVRTLITSLVVSSFITATAVAAPNTESIQRQRDAAQGEVNSLQEEMTSLLVEINELERKLVVTGEELNTATKDLGEAEEKEQKQYADMKLRIKYMYESGGYSALERLLTSGSFGEFLSQSEYVRNVHSYDRKKLDEYAETKQQIAELKEKLETEQKEQEETHKEFMSQQEALDALLTAKRSEVADLDEQFQAAVAAAAEETRAKEEARAREEGGEKETPKVVGSITTNQNQDTGPSSSSSAGQTNAGANTVSGTNDSGNGRPESSAPSEPTPAPEPEPAPEPQPQPEPEPEPAPAPEPQPEPEPAPAPQPESGGNTAAAQAIVNAAYSQLGTPYVWGGNTPYVGLDCSGLTKYCHQMAGISIPRYSGDQGAGGRAVSNPQPGDIVCYVGHVAIYIGNGQMIHAPQPGDVVKVQKVYGNPWYRRYW